MADKPTNGSMQISGGKMRLYVNDQWQDFGISYVVSDMRRIAKPVNGRRTAYGPIIAKIANELDRGGLSAVRASQETLKAFWGCSERWMAQDCRIWYNWLNQIYQFRNCTGKKDVPIHAESNRNYRENMDKIFNNAA
jgi:hypothetical protein